MPFELIRKLFRRKGKGWMSVSKYLKRHERELKRNPRRFEQEQEQALQWSLRVASKSRSRKEEK